MCESKFAFRKIQFKKVLFYVAVSCAELESHFVVRMASQATTFVRVKFDVLFFRVKTWAYFLHTFYVLRVRSLSLRQFFFCIILTSFIQT